MSYKLMTPLVSPGVQRKDSKVQFILTGFKPDLDFRIFAFESNSGSGLKTQYSVKVDLSLARKYGIQTQALPLLCFALLERSDSATGTAFTYNEDEMRLYARTCKEERAAAVLKRQSIRKTHHASAQPGVGWRGAAPQANG